MNDSDWQPRQRHILRYVVISVVVGAVVLLVTQWKTINDWTRDKPTPAALQKMAQARKDLDGDSFADYRKADHLLQSALVVSPNAAETNAAFAQLQFRWADALRYQAQGGPPQAMYYELIKRGKACTKTARVQAPDIPIVRRALAAQALMADPPKPEVAAKELDYPGAASDPTAVYLRAEIALLHPTTHAAARKDLQHVLALDPGFVRAHYELAQLALKQTPPDLTTAKQQLQAVLSRAPDHDLAKALLAHIDASAPVAGHAPVATRRRE